jgi:hypothetical protein
MIDNVGAAVSVVLAFLLLMTGLLYLLARLEPTAKPSRDPSAGRHRSSLPAGRGSPAPYADGRASARRGT